MCVCVCVCGGSDREKERVKGKILEFPNAKGVTCTVSDED